MKNYLFLKLLVIHLREYIFIILTATLLFFAQVNKIFAEENVFTISDISIKAPIDLKFSREKYINEAFINSFEVLMSKILVSRDLSKIDKININKIKELIKSFQILEESYRNDEYSAKFKIYYNEKKVKKFLGGKNISFSQPENISAIFFPVLLIDGEIKNFRENFFYNKWNEIKIKNELINFIMPLEDLEDVSKIIEMKNTIEELDVNPLVNKYDLKNYVFALFDYQNYKMNVHVKTNFNNNMISKNFLYKIDDINKEIFLSNILEDLKAQITDLWREENLVNLLMPLSISLKFQHSNLKELNNLRSIFYKMSIIERYTLEEFNTNNSFFKIYYYGNPKKLKTELKKFGYQLKNDQGSWQIYLNE